MCPGCDIAIAMLETAQPAPHSLSALAEEAARTSLISGHEPEPENEPPLYAARRKVYPQHVAGTYRRVKWIVLCVTLGIYYLLPFVRWDRGPNAPSQAVLIDFPNRRFYFFFIEIWPQEFYYLTGLLILAAMALFLMNAIAGRLWCGYLCPQTVWTDLFQAIERWTEGDRREHLQRDRQPWTVDRLARSGTKDRKSTRLNSSHVEISYAVFCLKKKKKEQKHKRKKQKKKKQNTKRQLDVPN